MGGRRRRRKSDMKTRRRERGAQRQSGGGGVEGEKRARGLGGRRVPSVLRKAGAPAHHNMTMSEITVSPQHPCEVGWKVAAIVMPTSQTKPGHRGRRESGGGRAWGGAGGGALGPAPLTSSPRPTRARADPRGGRPQHTVTWTRGKDRGVKNKRMQRTKPKKVTRRGENIRFLPEWPDFE